MRIIGIDPGMAITGYCVLDTADSNAGEEYNIISSGSVQTHKKLDDATRLLEIHQDINELIKIYQPDVAAIEQIFFFKNAKTIVPVCEARGVIIMSFRMHNIPVYEYTPLVIKQTITGYGRACKEDVKDLINIIIGDQKIPKLDDAVDAIAIAICHSRHLDNRVVL